MIPHVVMKKTIHHNYKMTSTFKTNALEPPTMTENFFIRVQKLVLIVATTLYFYGNEDEIKPGTYQFRVAYSYGFPIYCSLVYKELENRVENTPYNEIPY
jgi:hypothetical protein